MIKPQTIHKQFRRGNQIIEVTTEITVTPAEVDFDDILEACEIVPDDDCGKPWDECDGYEHEVLTNSRTKELDGPWFDRRGYLSSHRRYSMVILSDNAGFDDFEFYRSRGCSKQVAREMVAWSRQRLLDQLVKWYEDGWHWYGVKCEFMGQHESLWGIDDYDYADDEVRPEIAEQVASALEKEGYTILNRPDPEKRLGRRWTRKGFIDNMKRNLKLDCWE